MGKYEEALERAKQGLPIDEVFPELRESEDERIRKALLRCCDDWEKGQFGCMAKEDVPAIRAYLEKQKEQKPAEWSEEDEAFLDSIEEAISSYYDLNHAPQYHYWLENKLKSLRPQPQHPEIDLEKFTEKIKTFQGRYKHPESISIKGAMAFMARMFYQYPNVARKWYDSLPKATMD